MTTESKLQEIVNLMCSSPYVTTSGPLSPRQINQGWCFEFADWVKGELPEAEVYETRKPNHRFLKIGNKYYDAETPEGVRHFTDLPIYQRTKAIITEPIRIHF